MRVTIPSLRERLADIPELVRALLRKHAGNKGVSVSPQAMVALQRHDWPGNIRELENALRAALVVSEGRIEEHALPEALRGSQDVALNAGSLKTQVAELETRLIESALRDARGNQTKAALALSVSRYGLQKMIKRLGVDLSRFQ